MELGEKILLLRKFVGFSQKQLASELGITESRLSEYESDKYQPGHDILFDISKICNMHVGYFYDNLLPEKYYQVSKHLKYALYLCSLPEEVSRYFKKMLKFAYDFHNKEKLAASTEITRKKKNSHSVPVPYHKDYFDYLKKQSVDLQQLN